MKRFFIPNTGPDSAKIQEAYLLGAAQCLEVACHELTLVVPTRSDLPSILAGDILGRAKAKLLAAGKAVKFTEEIHLRCESAQTLSKRSEPAVILACYVPSKDMDFIDSLHTPKSVILLPWIDAEGRRWQRTWNAEIPGQSSPDQPPILDPELEKALLRLTHSINLSTGLSHPNDMRDAKTMFSVLRDQGVTCDPAEVRIWAARHEWHPRHLDELEQMAKRYLGSSHPTPKSS